VKLNPQQLESHVSGGLAPVYLISGDEPLLVDEVLARLRSAAVEQGYTERERHVAERSFDWSELAAGLQNLSLFAERRIIELRLPTGKPGDKGSRFLVEVATNPTPDTVIVVITPSLDKRTQKSKWATSLMKAGAWLPLYSPGAAELPAWIADRLAAVDLRADRDALQLLVSQVEGNLLAAKQEIDKLVLLATDGRITVDTVRTSVADGARFDVFQLGDAALAGNGARAARILYSLEKEGVAAPLVLWSIVRESIAVADVILMVSGGQSVGQAMANAGVWSKRQNLFRRATQGRDTRFARGLIASASRADRIVKGSLRGRPWNALLELTMTLASNDDGWRAETV
jgi:DNA polymerase-3 subunit delta